MAVRATSGPPSNARTLLVSVLAQGLPGVSVRVSVLLLLLRLLFGLGRSLILLVF